MSKSFSASKHDVVRNVDETEALKLSWGQLVWLVGEVQMPDAEQTLGVVTIQPGNRNPLHMHPNCEELLYVLEGEAEHKLGDETFHITAGDVIRIPRGVQHWAEAKGNTPLKAIISFSAANRLTENLEKTDGIS